MAAQSESEMAAQKADLTVHPKAELLDVQMVAYSVGRMAELLEY